MDFTSIISLISIIFAVPAFVISFFFNMHSLNINRTNKFSDNITENNILEINHPELSYLFNNKKVEKMRKDIVFYNKMSAYIYLHLNMLENLYAQLLSKKLFVTKEQKKVWEDYILEMYKIKLVVEKWKTNKNLYDKKFVYYIDKLIGNKKDGFNWIKKIFSRKNNKA